MIDRKIIKAIPADVYLSDENSEIAYGLYNWVRKKMKIIHFSFKTISKTKAGESYILIAEE